MENTHQEQDDAQKWAEVDEADRLFQIQPTALDEWLDKHRVDPYSTKPKAHYAEDGGEIIDGLHYPPERTLRDPVEIREWVNALTNDVATLVQKTPTICTQELQTALLTQARHSNLTNYYLYIAKCIACNPPLPNYLANLHTMLEGRIRIRNGESVDYVEADIQAHMMKRKDQAKNL